MSSKSEAHYKKTKLLVLSAPSGAGKSTLAKMLIEKYPKHFTLSISATTRAPRTGEIEGIHYYFIDEERFKEMVKQGLFLEHAHVFHKYWYGTLKEAVDRSLDSGLNVVFDIDVQGAKSIKKIYKERCLTLFIHPPSMEELKKRLENRKTESKEAIEHRLKTAVEEIKEATFFDRELTNVELNMTFVALIDCLNKEGFFA